MFTYINEVMLFIRYNFKIKFIRKFLREFYFNFIEENIFKLSYINKVEPYDNLNYHKPTNHRIVQLKAEAKAESSHEVPLTVQEKDKLITKHKEEFKEFYTTCKDSIKLSNYEFEKLSIKVAIAYSNGT